MSTEATPLSAGALVRVRQRTFLVEQVLSAPDASPVVSLACVDDDAQGQRLDVIWDAEVDARVLPSGKSALCPNPTPEDPRTFAAYLHALRWGCGTSTDPTQFEAPLRASREDQNTVSKALRAQVLGALRDLLAGLDQANRLAPGGLLPLDRTTIYPALVSVILRMVFVLFAEEKGLLPMESETYAASYSLSRLHAELQRDLERRGQTLDDRFGAWGRVIALFRLLHGGCRAADGLRLPARHGRLFDPGQYPFLEGRAGRAAQDGSPADLPRISDGTILRVLSRLVTLDGEKLEYRSLNVEHIGSAYEGLMGFEVRIAQGTSLTLQPEEVVVDVDGLVTVCADDRVSFLADQAGLGLKGKPAIALRAAESTSDLLAALSSRASPRHPAPIPRGALFLQPSEERRRFGAHYTSRALTRVVVERALAPLLREAMSPEDVLSLKVCDPAMGSGAFLVEACRRLAEHLVRAWERAGTDLSLPADEDPLLHARRLVAQRCLYGVDKNPLAVDLARMSLWLETFAREHPFTFVDHALRSGDSLLGLSREQIANVSIDVGRGTTVSPVHSQVDARIRQAVRLRREILEQVDPSDTGPLAERLAASDEALRQVRRIGDLLVATTFGATGAAASPPAKARRSTSHRAAVTRDLQDLVQRLLAGEPVPGVVEKVESVRARHAPFHWEIELPEVFEHRGGFDAILGNPPWISYAGRAAQPLSEGLRSFYSATSEAFAGYRNLQGIFVERSAAMLRPGGRLGLVLPTSMSDLDGYEPSRRAHDRLCACDEALPDFGDAFDDVFQPSMGLLSTRRAAPVDVKEAGPWPLERRDLPADAALLLERLSGLPKLPSHLFGERGLQTVGGDVRQLHELPAPEGRFTTGVRVGGDIEPFLRRPPTFYCDPADLGGRLRPAQDWQTVKLLIRQTARFPIAALSDGTAFRNSLLAGFEDAEHSAHFMLAYLNSTPIRWYHYYRHRDARQGMPQMKIGHLRALPALPRAGRAQVDLERFGAEIGERNSGITPPEQERIDALVALGLGLDDADRTTIAAWTATMGR